MHVLRSGKLSVLVVGLPLALAHCGGSETASDAGVEPSVLATPGAGRVADGGAAPSSTIPSAPGRSPLLHRATASACTSPLLRPPGTGSSSATDSPCTTDAQCSEGRNGRCYLSTETVGASGPTNIRNSCSYDDCVVDTDCGGGATCGCGTSDGTGGREANTCQPGNCRVDSDCGSDGYCSPTSDDPCSGGAPAGYYCHTLKDTCLDDADCAPTGLRTGECVFQQTVGVWACSTGGICTG